MYNKNFRRSPTEKQIVGEIGENSACKYLESKGYRILERNYSKKWGEIDIVCMNNEIIHFVEVKSVSKDLSGEVIRETSKDSYRAEDNMHPWKLKRLSRAIQSYLLDRNVSDETNWQFDVAIVYIDQNKRLSRVSLMEDVVIG